MTSFDVENDGLGQIGPYYEGLHLQYTKMRRINTEILLCIAMDQKVGHKTEKWHIKFYIENASGCGLEPRVDRDIPKVPSN